MDNTRHSLENNNLTPDQEEVLRNIEIPNTVNVHIRDYYDNSIKDKDIKEMNSKFKLSQKIYEDVLVPQLEQNEDLK